VLVCPSEALKEAPPVEEAGLEGESWAKPLTHLWQNRPPNLKKEKVYNQRMGSKAPYCSICTLFHTYQQVIWTRADSHPHIPTNRPYPTYRQTTTTQRREKKTLIYWPLMEVQP